MFFLVWSCPQPVLAANLRELGAAQGMAPDFSGPMAKPQRMATVTAAALVTLVWPAALYWALWVVIAGALLTAARRSRRLLRHRPRGCAGRRG